MHVEEVRRKQARRASTVVSKRDILLYACSRSNSRYSEVVATAVIVTDSNNNRNGCGSYDGTVEFALLYTPEAKYLYT